MKSQRKNRTDARIEFPLLEKITTSTIRWIGSVSSLVVHTLLFITAFSLALFGFNFEVILLALTTVVSLEAIYLAIFIQMTVNKSEDRLDEIREDVEELEGEIEEDEREEIARDKQMMEKIEGTLARLIKELEEIKKK